MAFEYHPLEICICGFSGAGKTTLTRKLVAHLSPRFRVGFVKSDAHRFDMDHAGKDTELLWEAGAASVAIFDPQHHALITRGGWDVIHRRSNLDNCDFVLIEGRKRSPIPKLVMLGGRDDMRALVDSGEITDVRAFVGADQRPPTGLEAYPYFQRDAVAEIAAFILTQFPVAPLRGLVLAGGESRRMQRDKALLEFGGRTQLERTVELLAGVVDEVFVSARPGQREIENVIPDRFNGFGPAGGILSALHSSPHAWLVVACDLPRLDRQTLDALVRARSPYRLVTAFHASETGLPEPLCAIYEPRGRARWTSFLGLDMACPRRWILNSASRLIDLPNPSALDNLNTPDDLARVRADLEAGQ